MARRSLLIGILAVSVSVASRQPAQLILIDHATIIDGTGQPSIPNGAILVRGKRIRQIGPRENIHPGPGATIVDATGKWVIPGLIDAHVHFDQSGDVFTRPDAVDLRKIRSYEHELAWTKARLPTTFARYLASGVTGVVDMGGPMWSFEARALAGKTGNAPRVATAGPLISTAPELQFTETDPPVLLAHSPEHARQLVRRTLEYRPDLIKVLFIRSAEIDVDRQTALVKAATEESHSHGVRVAVHATELESAKIALRAGADILVHSVEDRPVDREFIDLIKSRNVLYITTLVVSEGYDEVFGQAVNLTDIERRVGDPQVIASWAELARTPLNEIPGGVPQAQLRSTQPTQFKNLRLLNSAGVRIVAGTDAGNIGTLHGPALHREFELMAEAGMRPVDILVAATRNAAAVMGKEAELGTLERGKLADLVLLDADPTGDIRNARKINRVMKNGVFVELQKN